MTDSVDAGSDRDEPSSGIFSALPIILWQRRLLVLIPAGIIAVAAIAAAFLLPRAYVSKAVLLVETQSVAGTNTPTGPASDVIDRRMAKIRQQILSRPDLVELIQTNNLYDAASRNEPLSKLVDRMRDATEITAVDADIGAAPVPGKAADSIAFSLTFEYPRPSVAQFVAQTFVNRLLALDASESQAQAQDSVRFLEDQQASLQKQVDAIEGQINQITGQNGAALANGGAGIGMITIGGGDYDSQIASLRRENAQLMAQTGGAGVERDPGVLAAEAQLASARARYSDSHPDVKLAQSQLAAAKANAASTRAGATNSIVQQQIAANNQSIAELSAARGAAQGRAATAVAAQARGPVVAQQVSQLQAKADLIRADLGRVTTNLLNARSYSKITDEQRGERLKLIDPPVTPDVPTKPNRPLLILGGIFGGLAVGIALALLVELVQRPIRNVATLTRIIGAPPLVVIPVLPTRRHRRTRVKHTQSDDEAEES